MVPSYFTTVLVDVPSKRPSALKEKEICGGRDVLLLLFQLFAPSFSPFTATVLYCAVFTVYFLWLVDFLGGLLVYRWVFWGWVVFVVCSGFVF